MAGAAGLEPATIGFGDRCSTNWNYAPAKWTPIILTNKLKTRVKDMQKQNSLHYLSLIVYISNKTALFLSFPVDI